MLFNSAEYAGLLITGAAVSWLFRHQLRLRGLVLLGLSLAFYLRWNISHPALVLTPERFSLIEAILVCLGLLLLSSLMDFLISRRLDIARTRRRPWLVLSVVVNLGILATFKYFDFFAAELGRLLGRGGPTLGLLAPMGISFYTFQTLSYVVDVYRRKSPPARSYADYLLYLSFFPQLVMGPIVRSHELLPQIESPPTLTEEEGSRNLLRIGTGLVKKLVIADFLRAQIVDPVFTNPEMYSSVEALAAVYAYAFQIYADFSGYTDIAIGSAGLMGFRIPENFRAPYRAENLRDFWQRWHITLSAWLRDYLYIPLGGSRCAAWRIYLNLMITMLLGGLWHGPALTFVIWGGIHGLALVATRLLQRARRLALPERWSRGIRLAVTFPLVGLSWLFFRALPRTWQRVLAVLLTFHVVTLAWVFFRAPTVDIATRVLRQVAALDFGIDNLTGFVPVVLLAAALTHLTPDRWTARMQRGFHRLPAPLQAVALIAAVLLAERVASTGVSPFIYSQF